MLKLWVLELRVLDWWYVFDKFVQDRYVLELSHLDLKDVLHLFVWTVVLNNRVGLLRYTGFTLRFVTWVSHSFHKGHFLLLSVTLPTLSIVRWAVSSLLLLALLLVFFNYYLLTFILLLWDLIIAFVWVDAIRISILLSPFRIQVSCKIECTVERGL